MSAVTPGGRALDAALTEWGRIVREPITGDPRGAASIDDYIRGPQGLGWPSADVLRPGERRAYTRNGQLHVTGAGREGMGERWDRERRGRREKRERESERAREREKEREHARGETWKSREDVGREEGGRRRGGGGGDPWKPAVTSDNHAMNARQLQIQIQIQIQIQLIVTRDRQK